MTPYQYVSNNPIMRIDPTGMNDYSINRETGQIKLIRETKDKFDRIMNTDKKGNIKIKGEGFLGFLTKKSERGKEKVLMDNISQGILKDGINFKNEFNVIPVNGDSQPNDIDFQNFIQSYSGLVGVEVSGYGLGNSVSNDNISAFLVEPHNGNERDKSNSRRINKNIMLPDNLLGGYKGHSKITKIHYHTHPDDGPPSEDDKFFASQKNVLHYIYGTSTNTQYNSNGAIKKEKRNK